MNLQQAKIILEKINRLYQSITLDSKIDPFEQELMLSYIEKFHEAFSNNEKKISSKKSVTPPTPVVEKTPIVVSKPVVKEEEQPKAAAPIAPPPAAAKEVKAPIIEEIPVVITPPKPKPVAETPPPAPAAKPKANEEFDILFDQHEGNELSDRLSSLPIKDLTKAMGLNERILTTNELFDKDSEAFNAAMKDLNGLRDFEEAKMTLATYAEKYNWTERNKKKKAQIFIKLVQRKFK